MKAKKAEAPLGFAAGLAVLVVLLAACSLAILGEGETSAATMAISMKQPAAKVVSAALVVTGPDMAPITRPISLADSRVSLEVPAGKARTFRVLISTVSVTFMGESTVDLVAGKEALVTVHPRLYATQIIVPDATNGRIVQVSDMNGAGWIDVNDAAIGYDPGGGPFKPYDIDFDAQGRIYVANNPDWSEGAPAVLRLDDINAPTYVDMVNTFELPSAWVKAIAVDRNNGYLYYTTGSDFSIYRKKLDPLGSQEEISIGGIEGLSTTGLAVDPEGNVYVTIDSLGWPPNTLLKVDGASGSVIASYGYPDVPAVPLNDPWDVMVKSPYVYVSNTTGEGPSIVQLTENLVYVNSYGTPWYGEGESPPGVFHGPRRFLAPLNPGFFLTDEYYSNTDRILFFSELKGAGWRTYGSQGAGRDQFSLYVGVF